MTRLCCGCGMQLGEKCAQCGAKAIPVGHAVMDEEFAHRCVGARAHLFPRDEGGITSGFCPDCLNIFKAQHEVTLSGAAALGSGTNS